MMNRSFQLGIPFSIGKTDIKTVQCCVTGTMTTENTQAAPRRAHSLGLLIPASIQSTGVTKRPNDLTLLTLSRAIPCSKKIFFLLKPWRPISPFWKSFYLVKTERLMQ